MELLFLTASNAQRYEKSNRCENNLSSMYSSLAMYFWLELRQYKNNSDQFDRIPRLNLPHFLIIVCPTLGQISMVFSECKQKQTWKILSSSDWI